MDPSTAGTRVEANGVSFNVVEHGEGEPVLLLHGFPDSSRLWRHQVPALAGAGFRVIAPDLRGFGESDRPEGVDSYSIPVLLGDVAGILDALGVERARVVGHDWGSALAWAAASFLPDRVERLVAVSVGHPASFGSAGFEQWEKSWYMLWFRQEGVAEEGIARDDWRFLREWTHAKDVDRYVADLSRPGALTAALNWYRANIDPAMFGSFEPAPFPPVPCPTMGVWSTGDMALTEAQMKGSEAFVAGPWRYERVEGAGHWIPLDAPDELNALLLDFLSG